MQESSGLDADDDCAQAEYRAIPEGLPHDAALDRGFASKQNVVDVEALGVVRVDFGEGRGIDTEKACGNPAYPTGN